MQTALAPAARPTGEDTTLSAFLLAATALLLLFGAAAGGTKRRTTMQPFLLSQAAMFALLAFDERFQLHERIGYRLDIEDHFVMLTWAAAEVGLLGLFCRLHHLTPRMVALFTVGAACFALMVLFDALVPHDMILRLSIEDLAKVWGTRLPRPRAAAPL